MSAQYSIGEVAVALEGPHTSSPHCAPITIVAIVLSRKAISFRMKSAIEQHKYLILGFGGDGDSITVVIALFGSGIAFSWWGSISFRRRPMTGRLPRLVVAAEADRMTKPLAMRPIFIY
jgi:hypothetical protein